MKEKTAIFYFKSLLIFCFVVLAWVACDIIDSYDISWPTYDKHLEQSKISYDLQGRRIINNGWGE